MDAVRRRNSVNHSMLYSIGFTEEGHSFEPPVRHENEYLSRKIRGRQKISKIILGYEIEPYPTIRTGKEAVCLLQDDRSTTLRTRMFDLPGMCLYFFTALIAINRLRQIFSITMRAFFRMRLLAHGLSTLGTEFPMGRQILATLGALLKNEELVAAIRTESGLLGNRMLTIRTFEYLLDWEE